MSTPQIDGIDAPEELAYDEIVVRFDCTLPGDRSRGLVPAFRLQVRLRDGPEVGHLSVRVGNTDHVRLYAGHLGYEIRPEARGHGYARKACLAIAPWIRSRFGSVIVTADSDNLPSLRTIERIGARFLEEIEVPPHDPQFERGSRRKRRFEWRP